MKYIRNIAQLAMFIRGCNVNLKGRTFGSLIHSYLDTQEFKDAYLPLYDSKKGREHYERLLENVSECFPQYVQELKGMAEGANVPFYKLFLLHTGDLLPSNTTANSGQGCTTLCINESEEELIGHTEDGLKNALNHLYIVNVHITENESHEAFTALCYAGLLPGYSMGFNIHGLIFTVNIIHAKHLNLDGIPRTFIARSLLSADSLQKAENILRCKGKGIADAMSVNITFLNQKGDRLFHNIEVGPNYPPNGESSISILTTSPGEQLFHFNKLCHLSIPENDKWHDSSIIRDKTKKSFGYLLTKKDLINFLGDTSHPLHNVFRDGNADILTLAVGLFDLKNQTWNVYTHNPKSAKPVITLSLRISV